ncbi:MAG: hypothetical protein QXU40_02820 [Candidatus Pacearchaeota archaeon]
MGKTFSSMLLRFILLILIFSSLGSAEIIINKQPNQIYNLGDVIQIPITIKSASSISGFFNVDLICGGSPLNFFRNTLRLSAGEEKRMEPSLALIKEVINDKKGECKIKAYVGDEYILTNEFKISDRITINAKVNSSEFSPGDNILIEGKAIKENGESVNGFIEVSLRSLNSTILTQKETIKDGFFQLNISLNPRTKAGQYYLNMYGYDLEPSKNKANEGYVEKRINIKQIPTTLDLIFEKNEIKPGDNLKIKVILYDQSGDKMQSNSVIIIKNKDKKIVERMEIPTGEISEFKVPEREAPSLWEVTAISGNFSTKKVFRIIEKEEVSVSILNKTLIIENIGNVPYNKTATIKIGNKIFPVDLFLRVGEKEKYTLTAPNGDYQVSFVTNEKSFSSNVVLTGDSINVKRASKNTVIFFQKPIIWVITGLLLLGMTFILFKRGYKRTFIGYATIPSKKRVKEENRAVIATSSISIPLKSLPKDSLLPLKENRAEISLSIKGEKQEISLVTLQIRNFEEVLKRKEEVRESLEKISETALRYKALVNESNGIIFFIFSPTKTKTFKNERDALELAQTINSILKSHNKIFRQRINFGISIVCGEIIGKMEGGVFKFMALGNLTTLGKKIASLSNEEVLISDKMNEKIVPYAKTIKNESSIPTYTIKEMKNSEEHKKFISKFLERNT